MLFQVLLNAKTICHASERHYVESCIEVLKGRLRKDALAMKYNRDVMTEKM